MSITQIEFVDRSGNSTVDFINGFPTVRLNFDFDYVHKPGVKPDFSQCRALVDTGATNSVFDLSLVGDRPKREVQEVILGGFYTGWVIHVLAHIEGLREGTYTEVGCADLASRKAPFMALVGRDLLSKACMLYDPPNRVFTLKD